MDGRHKKKIVPPTEKEVMELLAAADRLQAAKARILEANARDIAQAEAKGVAAPMVAPGAKTMVSAEYAMSAPALMARRSM